ncbi:MAG: CerR family C-terminal domain-containing protein [Pirellulales bacterium]
MSTDDTKTRLLDAAGPIFAEAGYDGATIRDICKAAGVNVASVNYYFGDKQRLYVDAVKTAHRQTVERIPQPDFGPDMTPEDKLRALIQMMIQRMLASHPAPWQLRLVMREVLHPSEAGRELVEDYFRPIFNLLVEIVGELLPASTSREVKHRVAFSIVGQCVYHRIARDVVTILLSQEEMELHYTPDRLAKHIFEFSLGGLRAVAARSCGEACESADDESQSGRAPVAASSHRGQFPDSPSEREPST